MTIPYTKPAKSLDDQVDLLVRRGLDVADRQSLRDFLARVSFYRLRGFTYPFQDNTNPDHPFHPGASWERVLATYEFDHALRLALLGAMEDIEIALRTQLVLHMSLAKGANWYEDPRNFRSSANLASDLVKLREEWDRSHDEFAKHHKAVYDPSMGPPAWKIFETGSLGQVSKFLENLQDNLAAKGDIVEFFGLPRGATSVLASWVRHLNVVRNICAHHGRLWNRVIRVRPMFPRKTSGPWVEPWPDHDRVWTTLTILLYWTDRIRAGNDLRERFGALLTQADAGMLRSMGVPQNWREQALWKTGVSEGIGTAGGMP